MHILIYMLITKYQFGHYIGLFLYLYSDSLHQGSTAQVLSSECYLEIIHFYHEFDFSVGLYCNVCIKKS